MLRRENNFAFVDGANLYEGVKSLGWRLDYCRFRKWLSDKYSITVAYLFLGYIPECRYLYTRLERAGFVLIFKEVVHDKNNKVKGNCDADLVLHAVRGCYEGEFDKCVIISSDGDYACLVSFLLEKNKICSIISPSDKCSILIKRTGVKILYLDNLGFKVGKNKKALDMDRTI